MGDGNSQIYLLVKEVNQRSAKNGKPFLSIALTDGRDSIIANMFDTTAAQFPGRPGEVVFLTVRVSPYNGKTSYTVESARSLNYSDPVKTSDFVKSAPMEPGEIYSRCLDLLERYVADEEIKTLCKRIFEDNREALIHSAAAKTVHHSGVGELLWHVYRMALVAPRIADVYRINKDLTVAGALLHDIGKLREMVTDAMGVTSYTIDGNLFGHLMMGAEMIAEYGKECGTSPEKIRALRHIIASHHGKLEQSAIVLPATPEAFAVYMLDTLDSRLYIYDAELEKIEPGQMSERIHFLETAVWKPDL